MTSSGFHENKFIKSYCGCHYHWRYFIACHNVTILEAKFMVKESAIIWYLMYMIFQLYICTRYASRIILSHNHIKSFYKSHSLLFREIKAILNIFMPIYFHVRYSNTNQKSNDALWRISDIFSYISSQKFISTCRNTFNTIHIDSRPWLNETISICLVSVCVCELFVAEINAMYTHVEG